MHPFMHLSFLASLDWLVQDTVSTITFDDNTEGDFLIQRELFASGTTCGSVYNSMVSVSISGEVRVPHSMPGCDVG